MIAIIIITIIKDQKQTYFINVKIDYCKRVLHNLFSASNKWHKSNNTITNHSWKFKNK